MTKPRKEKMLTALVILLVAIAFAARFISGGNIVLPGLIRSIIYIDLTIIWGLSLRNRIIQVQTRRYLTVISALAIIWMLLRTMKFFFIPEQSMMRPVWYLYYLPMLFIPLMAVFVAASLGKPENYRLPKGALALYIPTALMLLLVLTNDFHQLVFVFPSGKPWTDLDYSYGFGFYFVAGWEVALTLAAFAVMVRRCRVRSLKTAAPLIFMGLSIIYAALYTAGTGWLLTVFGDLTVVQCCLIGLSFESCIRCGLIQSNTGYDDLFEACTLGAQITDNNYCVKYASLLAPKLTRKIMREAEKAPVRIDKNTLVKSNAIPGGHVLWKEDITELTAVIEDLEAAGCELEEKNFVAQENYNTKRRISKLREKNRLLDLMQQKTEDQIDILYKLLARYESETDESRRRKLLAMTAVVGSYIKRCGNLVFISERDESADIEELSRCFEESFSNLELLGVACACDLPEKGTVCAKDAIRAYHIFETVIEASMESLNSVWLKAVEDEAYIALRIEVFCEAGLSHLSGIADSYCEENGDFCFTVRMKKGGEQS